MGEPAEASAILVRMDPDGRHEQGFPAAADEDLLGCLRRLEQSYDSNLPPSELLSLIDEAEGLAADEFDQAVIARFASRSWLATGRARLAEDRLRLAIDIFAVAGSADFQRASLNELGHLLLELDRPAEAVDVFERALRLLSDAPDPLERLTGTSNLAAALQIDGRLDDAHQMLEDSITELEDLARAASTKEIVRALAAALVNAATLAERRSRPVLARDQLVRASELVAGIDDPGLAARTLANLAAIENQLGLHESALRRYRAASVVFLERGDGSWAAHALRGVAASLAQLGRYDEAEAAYRDSTREWERLGQDVEAARTRIGWAMALEMLDRRTEALEALDDALDAAPLGHLTLRAQVRLNSGNIRLRAGSVDAAEADFRAAVDLATRGNSPGLATSASSDLAVCLRRQGQYEEAIEVLEREMAERKQRHDERGVAHAGNNLAAVLLDRADAGLSPDAVQDRQRAVELAVAAFEFFDLLRYRLTAPQHRALIRTDQYAQVPRNAVRAATSAGQHHVVAAIVEALRVHGIPDREGEPWLADHPVRPLASPGRLSARSSDKPIGSAAGPWVDLQSAAKRLFHSEAIWLGSWLDKSTVHAVAVSDGCEGTRGAWAPETAAHLRLCVPVPLEWSGNRPPAQLRRIEALRLASTPLFRDVERAATIAASLRRPEREVVARALADLEESEVELLWDLSRRLLPPCLLERLSEAARAGEPLRLAIAPDPACGRIPWAALPIRSPVEGEPSWVVPRLIEAADLILAPPAVFSAQLEPLAGRGDLALAICDPLGDLLYASVPPPGVDLALGGKSGTPATAEAVVAALGDESFSLLVAQCHIQAGPVVDPGDTSLLLASTTPDGPFERIRIRDLAAAGASVPTRCLLFGCDSAGAASPEWTSVAASMLLAGADALIATVWPVPDDPFSAAADSDLVGRVLESGDIATSLWSFQRAALDRYRKQPDDPANQPGRWAGFVVITSGRHGVRTADSV